MERRVPRPVAALLAVLAVSGAVGGVAAGGRLVLHRQAAVARRVIGKQLGTSAPAADRKYKKKYDRRHGQGVIELLVLGDSIAAGLGADLPKQTLGARLATRLAKATRRTVRLRTVAQVGSETSMLASQLATLPRHYRPRLAVIIVGGNDVTHRVPVTQSVQHLQQAISDLRGRGATVVVGTCPDLGALRPVPQPLRGLASRASRQLARAQQATAVGNGAYAVALADVVGPFFVSAPEEMFSLDRFHPSALGYRRTADALLPSLLDALGTLSTGGAAGHELPVGHHRPDPPSAPPDAPPDAGPDQ